MVLGVHSALAQEIPRQNSADWLSDKATVTSLVSEELSEEGCQATWNILWRWAKHGNLESRAILLSFLLPPPKMAAILMPGRSTDFISRVRDSLVMAGHSVGVKMPNHRENEHHYQQTEMLFSEMPFGNIGGRKFVECVRNTRSTSCSEIAVKADLIPPFEAYASEIDALQAQGKKARCLNPPIHEDYPTEK